ncbi:single-stranded DNA-binding protein [Mastigocoleus sp. MO_188.B34]|uniref:single-stranded DNA-binding protein n=1 Tax=Mastigocoleus sp. MO_188.B34 TaxID=3036635 RepID=UPI002613A8E7|nr:single-stranded DNA-binding protein [Mastigocoleus sp. MO_188.B34]MDJ0693882.1 single-stranded DNA-binding protein [Mastigocoleus sp. MO_188.B34]
MNSCILMAEIIQPPQLRYTSDNLEVMEMMVQFASVREGESPSNLKVVAWRNTAKEIQQNYHQGDRVILEGRLGMSTIQRPEGFKEKRAELTVQRIYPLTSGANISTATGMENMSPTAANPSFAAQSAGTSFETKSPEPTFNSPVPAATPSPGNNEFGNVPQPNFEPAASPTPNYEPSTYPAMTEPDVDDIPFMRPIHSRSSWGHSLTDFFEEEVNSAWEGVKQFKP